MIKLDPYISSASPEEIHRDLEHAIAKHAEWLQRWHRCVLCGEPPGQEIVSQNARYLCHFGAWYELHKESNLIDQPAFHNVAEVHAEMHELAQSMVVKAMDGGRITAFEHDVLTDCVNEFNGQARRLAKAFGKVMSDLDPLTGIPNRQQMLGELKLEMSRYTRSGTPFSVAIADLDHFKRINDGHGHHIGDDVLRASVNRFISGLRPYDTIYRYGGEEFLISLPNTDLRTALGILQRLRLSLCKEPLIVGNAASIGITASFGVAEVARETKLEDLIEQADKALYESKETGRNRVCFWHSDDQDVRADDQGNDNKQTIG